MRISDWSSDVCSSDLVALPQMDFDLSAIDRITIVACGTSFYAGMVAKYWFETFARVPVDIDVASEFRYRDPVLQPGGLALFISQSGETAAIGSAQVCTTVTNAHLVCRLRIYKTK